MNKKLKQILCGAVAFVAGSVVLSACGTKPETEEPVQQEEQQQEQQETSVETKPETEEPVQQEEQQQEQQETSVETKTIIKLTEAKEIIVNALAVDNVVDNRDVLEKWGKFSENCNNKYAKYKCATNQQVGAESIFAGNAISEYKNGEIVNDLIKDRLSETYSANYDHQIYNYDYETKEVSYFDADDPNNNVQVGILRSTRMMINKDPKSLSDAMFGKYEEMVEKSVVENGYTLTLHLDVNKYISEMLDGHEGDQEKLSEDVRAKQCYKLKITFDNENQILAVNCSYVVVQVYEDEYMLYELNDDYVKYDGEIVEPEWVTAYKATQA